MSWEHLRVTAPLAQMFPDVPILSSFSVALIPPDILWLLLAAPPGHATSEWEPQHPRLPRPCHTAPATPGTREVWTCSALKQQLLLGQSERLAPGTGGRRGTGRVGEGSGVGCLKGMNVRTGKSHSTWPSRGTSTGNSCFIHKMIFFFFTSQGEILKKKKKAFIFTE